MQGYAGTPTCVVVAGESQFTYRELGRHGSIPLVLLTHLGANLDGWDPRVVDGLAKDRHLVAVGYRGVGNSAGTVRNSIDEMADDAIAVIRGLGHPRVDVLGLSMGGMVAQSIAVRAPELIERLILVGSGPAGGPGITRMTRVMVTTLLHAAVTLTDPKALLFFTRSTVGKQAARDYLTRLTERSSGRESPVSPGVYRRQLAAVHQWGRRRPVDLSRVTSPTVIVHGDSDRMVPVANADVLARRLPNATVKVFPDSGHGVAFQNHDAFVYAVTVFLRR